VFDYCGVLLPAGEGVFTQTGRIGVTGDAPHDAARRHIRRERTLNECPMYSFREALQDLLLGFRLLLTKALFKQPVDRCICHAVISVYLLVSSSIGGLDLDGYWLEGLL